MATGLVQIEQDREIAERLAAERLGCGSLRRWSSETFSQAYRACVYSRGAQPRHDSFGGLTWKLEELIRAVFLGTGLPLRASAGAERSRFPAGQGVRQQRAVQSDLFHRWQPGEAPANLGEGREPRQDILDNYVFFTAGSCGPCRFGMYESEYRLALRNAGFDGFRVLLFQTATG